MALFNFQKPDKVIMIDSTDFEGKFEFRPLEPGYGLTVGNALRRVLLASLEGFAITSVRIDKVEHEFSVIEGVVEDVTEIILNMKQIRFKQQIEDDLGLDPETVLLTSAKEGIGIEEVLEGIVNCLPPPSGDPELPLKALIFDSHYDSFRGTVVHIRVFQGTVKPKDVIMFMSNKAAYKVEEVGIFQIVRRPQKALRAGQVGYLIAGIKTVSDTR